MGIHKYTEMATWAARLSSERLVYLAGPYSGSVAERRERWWKLSAIAADLTASGVLVYSPITHGHVLAGHRNLPTDWTFWDRHCRTMVAACSLVLVAQLDGWHRSVGVSREIDIAADLGILVNYMEVDR